MALKSLEPLNTPLDAAVLASADSCNATGEEILRAAARALVQRRNRRVGVDPEQDPQGVAEYGGDRAQEQILLAIEESLS